MRWAISIYKMNSNGFPFAMELTTSYCPYQLFLGLPGTKLVYRATSGNRILFKQN